jgi:hypothetical protein
MWLPWMSDLHLTFAWCWVGGHGTLPGHGGMVRRPILADWRVILCSFGLGQIRHLFTSLTPYWSMWLPSVSDLHETFLWCWLVGDEKRPGHLQMVNERILVEWRVFLCWFGLVRLDICLHNHTIIVDVIAMNIRNAFKIHVALGGWSWNNPRSWWIGEATNIGGVTGHSVLIWTWPN